MVPELEFFSHIEELSEGDCDRLAHWSAEALASCLANPGLGSCDLPSLELVEISVVSDETITEVHQQFLDDPTPTDVITFQHGEILISYDTAQSASRSFEHSALEELFLYVVHGLLHLNGHLDKEKAERDAMHRIQDGIWRSVLDAAP